MTFFSDASVARDEVARFSSKADDWWNSNGAFGALHKMGPVRVAYIKAQALPHFRRKAHSPQPFRHLQFLDVGCGGGLLAEALARLGAKVTGIDVSPEAIDVARRHAREEGLSVTYRTGSAESLARSRAKFDAVFALEVVEHVADIGSFLKALARLLKPGGLLILSTLNRTPKSFLFSVLAAEYLLGWTPKGTHDWMKFKRPSELSVLLESLGLHVRNVSGVVFDPLTGAFRLEPRLLAVNYMLAAVRVNAVTPKNTHARRK